MWVAEDTSCQGDRRSWILSPVWSRPCRTVRQEVSNAKRPLIRLDSTARNGRVLLWRRPCPIKHNFSHRRPAAMSSRGTRHQPLAPGVHFCALCKLCEEESPARPIKLPSTCLAFTDIPTLNRTSPSRTLPLRKKPLPTKSRIHDEQRSSCSHHPLPALPRCSH